MGKHRLLCFNLGLFGGVLLSAGALAGGGYYVYKNVLPDKARPVEQKIEDMYKDELNNKLGSKITQIDFKYVTLDKTDEQNLFMLNGIISDEKEKENLTLTSTISDSDYTLAQKKFAKEYKADADLIDNYNVDGLYYIYEIMNRETTEVNSIKMGEVTLNVKNSSALNAYTPVTFVDEEVLGK